jgi:hypothetical protein
MQNIIEPGMLCTKCIEKKDCVPSGLKLFYMKCAECGKFFCTVAHPIAKKTPTYKEAWHEACDHAINSILK